jgi:hypothetical protein
MARRKATVLTVEQAERAALMRTVLDQPDDHVTLVNCLLVAPQSLHPPCATQPESHDR